MGLTLQIVAISFVLVIICFQNVASEETFSTTNELQRNSETGTIEFEKIFSEHNRSKRSSSDSLNYFRRICKKRGFCCRYSCKGIKGKRSRTTCTVCHKFGMCTSKLFFSNCRRG